MAQTEDHELCIWNKQSDCAECALQNRLQCHTQFRYSALMGLGFTPLIVMFLLGIIQAQLELSLIVVILGGWIGYMAFFFGFWEQRVLCRHCPFYAEDSRVLHCFDKWGIPKTTKYSNTPLSTSEKTQFLVGSGVLIGYPSLILLVFQQVIYAMLTLLGSIFWLIVLLTQICTRCLNFACPFNRVPNIVKEQFRAKNPLLHNST